MSVLDTKALDMWETLNFSRSEFACKCGCGLDTVDAELLYILQRLRTHTGEPINITSGCRCEQHNKSIGGSPKSQHVKCKAADITSPNLTPEQIYSRLTIWYPNKYGIGIYDGWVHLDVRKGKARWDKRDANS